MCPRTNDPSLELSELPVSSVKEIIDKVSPWTTKIQLSGGLGEPLLYQGLFEVMDYAKDRKMDVLLTSNGTLLDEVAAQKLLDRGVDYISISLDGATAETYEKIRVGARFDQVVENIRNLCRMKDEVNSKLVVELVPVVMVKENLHEVPDFIGLAHRLGVDGVGFSELDTPLNGEFDPNQTIRFCEDEDLKEEIERQFKKAKELAERLNIRISLPGGGRCRQPWNMLTVTTKGQVRPCCGGPHDLFFGNILEEGLEDIWNNEKFVDWRRRMLSNNPPSECLYCPVLIR